MNSIASHFPALAPDACQLTRSGWPERLISDVFGLSGASGLNKESNTGFACPDPESAKPKTRPSQALDWNSLLNSAKSGNLADQNQLFEKLRSRLVTVGKLKLRGWAVEDVEDIVQDALSVVFSKLDAVEDNPHYFALTVLENKIGGVLRLRKRRTMVSLNPTGSQSEQEDPSGDVQLPSDSYDEMLEHLHTSDLAEKLHRALTKLSPLCQAIFLALLQLRTVADVWEAYQEREPRLSRNAFDKRLFDCRRKLRDITAGQLA